MKRVLLLLTAGALLVSCGGESKDSSKEETKEVEVVKEEVKVEATNVVEVLVNSNDQMKFDLTEIKVKEGSTVKLTLKHTGKLPKAAMGHNLVILEQGIQIAEFATAAMKMKDSGYVPADKKGVIAFTDVIGGGESSTITFEAPAKGTYDFLCSFPGHYSIMNGKFIVE